ncbi:FAD-dependent oxidoreductase [Rubrobacter indicoceani]|uniref:FAD-dependent oxidoreductase n=1 Tax=Rubrobacter indicoceani TaxID=2051957 RepID=UPI000E5A989F|nr:FAD-dependent oxidoreductase [Rubrobacter indicoceani]
MRLVVIGGVAAGTKAASRAKRVAPELEVVVYQAEPEVSISECGLPYHVSEVIPDRERLVARTPEKFAENDIEAKVRHRVEAVDPEGRRLTVKNLDSGETFEDTYDRLIVATGSKSVKLPVPGADLEGVFTLKFLTDADAMKAYIKKRSPERAVVVGGGYIGLEMAENLHHLGMEVQVVEAGEHLAPTYGETVADRVRGHLEGQGVRVHVCAAADEVSCVPGEAEDCTGRVESVRFGDTELPADFVLVGIGVRPEVRLAESFGVKLGETGAIEVDENMRTNVADVWAAGDCVETTNRVSGKPMWLALGDVANKMGRVAGTNAATGQPTLAFPGVLGTGIFKVFDLGVGATGLSEGEARDAGFDPVSVTIEARDRAGYYPGARPVLLEMVADGKTGRVLGVEAVGSGVDKLTDVAATAIWARLTCDDLVNADLAYAPPFGPTNSPVIQAATVLSGKVRSS